VIVTPWHCPTLAAASLPRVRDQALRPADPGVSPTRPRRDRGSGHPAWPPQRSPAIPVDRWCRTDRSAVAAWRPRSSPYWSAAPPGPRIQGNSVRSDSTPSRSGSSTNTLAGLFDVYRRLVHDDGRRRVDVVRRRRVVPVPIRSQGAGYAPADCARRLVELDARDRRLATLRAALGFLEATAARARTPAAPSVARQLVGRRPDLGRGRAAWLSVFVKPHRRRRVARPVLRASDVVIGGLWRGAHSMTGRTDCGGGRGETW
jgi:hypothetical protein